MVCGLALGFHGFLQDSVAGLRKTEEAGKHASLLSIRVGRVMFWERSNGGRALRMVGAHRTFCLYGNVNRARVGRHFPCRLSLRSDDKSFIDSRRMRAEH